MKTLEELVGQRLVFGIPGPRLRDDDIRLFRESHAGGLILYRRNFESADQLVGLIRDFEEALGRSLLVTTDHEGGRIVMIRDGVTIFPDNLAAGNVGENESARRQGEIEARELRRLGIDVSFGPVLDVLTTTYSPNIGIRSYGRDPNLVARLGVARISAMQANRLSACAKHFPGKGHSPLDAHLALPTIGSTWEEMRSVHLVPFLSAIEAGVECVMTSHPIYPNLDPTPFCPATFSQRIVRDYLRDELSYQGVIVSDDLEMGAILEICAPRDAAFYAALAGHDLLLSCHEAKAQWGVFEGLRNAYKTKRLPLKDLEASVERIERLKAKRASRFEGGSPHPEPGGAELAKTIARRAVTVLQGEVPRARLRRAPAIIFPKLSSLAPRITIEERVLDEQAFLKSTCEQLGFAPEIKLVGIEPAAEEIDQSALLAAQRELTLLFLYDAHLFPSNKTLLDRVQASARSLVVVLLRDPYDIEFIREGVTCLTAYGWRLCQIEAVLEHLASR